tara:strand:- start:147 stop:293 length:147 start_codon:yes stop_codon:yes gene_type:complete
MQGKIEQLSIGNVNNKKFIQMAGLIGCFVFAGIFLFICSVFSFYLKSY